MDVDDACPGIRVLFREMIIMSGSSVGEAADLTADLAARADRDSLCAAETSVYVRPLPAWSSRHAAREAQARTRRSCRPASVRSLILTRPIGQPRSGNRASKRY